MNAFHVEKRGNVAHLRLDDGKVNAIGRDFLDGFPKAWSEATSHNLPVVITGNAKAFSAGLDLKALPTLTEEDLLAFSRGFMSVFAEVLRYPRPVVAFVDGPAIAGGAIIALACDFRVVTPRARMGVTEVPVGIPFPEPVLELVLARLPPQTAREAALRGSLREGPNCVESGWADRVGTLDVAFSLAEELGSASPLAFGGAKSQVNKSIQNAFDSFDAAAWVELLSHQDTTDALLRTIAKLSRR